MPQKPRIKLPRSVKRLFPQIEYVVDATKSVEVSVSRKDCKDAKKLNPTECALAQAAKRELKADAVIIGLSSSYVIRGKHAMRFHTPESVRREIVSFDRHHDFAPGDYHLAPKPPTAHFAATRPKREPYKGTKTAQRKIHHSARVRVLPIGVE